MNKSKIKLVTNQVLAVIFIVAGSIWGLFGLVGLTVGASEGVAVILVALIFFIAPAVLIFLVGLGILLRVNNFKKYVFIMGKESSGSLDGIAAALGKSTAVVKRDLGNLIRRGYFVDAFIDNDTNCIIIRHRHEESAERVQSRNSVESTANIEYQAVTCECCGGKNKILKGTVGECEYCGSPLK